MQIEQSRKILHNGPLGSETEQKKTWKFHSTHGSYLTVVFQLASRGSCALLEAHLRHPTPTFVFLQRLLCGLQHRLVELLGELLGGEAVPGFGATVGGVKTLFGLQGERRPQAVEQAGALLGEERLAAPPGLVRVDSWRRGFLWSQRVPEGFVVGGRRATWRGAVRSDAVAAVLGVVRRGGGGGICSRQKRKLVETETPTGHNLCCHGCFSQSLTGALRWGAGTQRVGGVSDGIQGDALLFDGLQQLCYLFIIW